MWIMGLVLATLGTIVGGVTFVTTILCMRAPGTTMFRLPIFTWHVLVTSLTMLIAFPVLLVLEIDPKLGARVFSAASGGATLWQHVFASRPAQLPRRTANPPRTGDTDV
ncbi:MAG TPA: cbb3-type cytochrome c oxidase subunit I [Trebonia sp.]|jgi:cytochrome c oxidase subunit 1|nr:cbb3-type cytochrome c oxidase subunit I [Trebonia sp.]